MDKSSFRPGRAEEGATQIVALSSDDYYTERRSDWQTLGTMLAQLKRGEWLGPLLLPFQRL